MPGRSDAGLQQPRPVPCVVVGRVLRPWGIRGEVKVASLSDVPQRFRPQQRFYIAGRPYLCERARRSGRSVILQFQGVCSCEEADALRGMLLEVPLQEVPPLPEGQYYHFQVLGLEVWTTRGQFLGRVAEIVTTGSNDIYMVRGAGREVLVPAVEDTIHSIDLEAGRITVEPLPGLL